MYNDAILTPYVTGGGGGAHYHITGSEVEATIKEQPGPGRGNRGCAATELSLNKTTAKSRQTTEAIAVRQLPPGQWL